MKTSKNLLQILFSLIFSAGLFFGAAQAQNMQHILPSLEKFKVPNSNQDSVNQTTSADLQTNFDDLTAKARENGTVRIIVGFSLENYRLDADLSSSDQSKQRGDIKRKQAELLNRLSNFAVTNAKQFDYIPFLAIEVSAEALAELRKSSDVNYIQEDQWREPSLLQSIPIIGANIAAANGWTGSGWTVAILDSGVDKFHPFFNNRVVSEACYSSTGTGAVSTCPGGATASTASGSGVNCNVSQVEGCFHGTHVAGISSGGNPNINGAGVARNSNIIAIQVFTYLTSNCGSETPPCIRTSDSDWARGLERVYALRTTYNIASANMSLGGGQYFNTCDAENALGKAAIDNLRSASIATVIASGNSSYTDSMGSPGCISSAISVGSTNDGDVLPIDAVSSFSNSAYFLHLLAPGELITSAYPGGFYYDTQGTSMASPMVAGAWAVMKQRYPTDTVTQTLTRLKYGGVQVLDSRNGLVKSRIRLDTAMNTTNVDPCSSVTGTITAGTPINGSLSNTDCLLNLGNRTDVYSFTGTAGQGVAITHGSAAFDTYLYLVNSSGAIVGQDNNGGGGTNSRIPAGSGFLTLPASGTYYIYSTSLEGNRLGNYTTALTATGGCNFTISSSGQNFTASGGAGNFNVTTAAGCAWTAQSNAAWLTTSSSGNGNGAVNYSVAANTSVAQRTGTITAGGQVHTVTQAGITTTTTRRPFDFDGDGKTDLAIFRPAPGEWWYLKSSNGGNAAAQFGASSDKIVPGDYTGDGKSDFAFFRPSTGQWFVLRSDDFSFFAFPLGISTDVPVPADYDGDGKTDAAVFRPSTLTWYINKSTGGTDIIGFGASGDVPTVADYDGDQKADIAIFRPSLGQWWIRRSSNGSVFAVSFGNSADKAVQGDYTGDGKADIAIFRPSNGNWFVVRSEDFSFYAFPFGTGTDIPTPGDYDGDNKFDAAVFRPSSTTWFVNRSSSTVLIQQFGIAGDLPVPNAYVP